VLLDSLNQSLLERARAWVLVADGGNPATVAALPWLHAGAAAHVGARPSLVLLNKRDLAPSRWNPGDLAAVRALGPVLEVSAASGEGIEAARRALAALLGN
jgi:50S ribosomal subunit-associated GTPase HflX